MSQSIARIRLTPDERRALELCGITLVEQLLAAEPSRIGKDLEAAHEAFPQKVPFITPERLAAIIREAAAFCRPGSGSTEAAASEHPARQASDGATTPGKFMQGGRETAETQDNGDFAEAAPRHHKTQHKGLDNYHATHPKALVCASLFLLLSIVSFFLLLYCCAMLLLHLEPFMHAAIPLGAMLLFFCAYMVSLGKSLCTICRGRMISVFSSKRSNHAHYIPLLGHTIPAACAVLFTSSTVCPHCGTRQNIFSGARPPSKSKYQRK